MDASSSTIDNVYELSISGTASLQCSHRAPEVIRPHEIFLSHSGKQKGFVKGLYDMLHPHYTTFFDICHHSLPLAEPFPDHIFYAAKTCKLAVVVLSDDFLRSKWPMLELCAFAEAQSVKILPLFYEVYSEDLKDEGKLKVWIKEWEIYAEKDTSGRINVSRWKNAFKQLCSYNGLVFKKSEGEKAYLQEIISCILLEVMPQTGKYEESGIWGMDRLCKVIFSRFEDLESQQLRISKQIKFSSPEDKICVLGMYGPSGSGKSTLSRCIHDKMLINFKGKMLHLELPTNPSMANLIQTCKDLLRHMTNQIYSPAQLKMASNHLRQMYHLFRLSDLQGSKVFLVLDNISADEDSIELVRAILQLCVGPGSKVLLVARTCNALRMCQDNLAEYYVCGIMRVPSLNEKEAIKVLLQRGGGVGLNASNGPEKDLSPSDKEVVEEVVRVSGFGDPENGVIYLPLVLRIMGHRLRESRLEWGMEMQSILTKAKTCKKEVVRELLQESFDKLSPKLQLLFLDLALFYLPVHGDCIKDACAFCSLLHECSPEAIHLQMLDLERSCFLSILHDKGEFKIHDMFLEFAKSIPESSRYYIHVTGAAVVSRYDRHLSLLAKCQLRAIVLELQGEEYDRLDFPAGFSSVKILSVRNSKSLRVLGLAGLTALVSLEVVDCPSIIWVRLGQGKDHNDLQSLRRFRWCNDAQEDISVVMPPQNRLSQWMQAGERWRYLLRNTRSFRQMVIEGGCPLRAMSIGVVGLTSQLRCLQVLTLKNTGIRRLEDMSRCWPQLKELEIFENHLVHMEVGSLPQLKRFYFSACGCEPILETYLAISDDSRMSLGRKNLLTQCPELEDVRICSSAFEKGIGMLTSMRLRSLWIKDVEETLKVLNLASSAPWHFVSEDCTRDQLTSLGVGCPFGDLRELVIVDCPSLAKVIGLHSLPSLQELVIGECPSLSGVHGFEGLTSLQTLRIEGCSSLRNSSGLSGLVRLEVLHVESCSEYLQVLFSDLENLTNLRFVWCDHFVPDPLGSYINVLNLEGMEVLEIAGSAPCIVMAKGSLEMLVHLRIRQRRRHHEVIDEEGGASETFLDLASMALLGVPYKPVVASPHQYLSSSCFLSITQLSLDGVQNLLNLNGIQFLSNLHYLKLADLQNLACLRGIEVLIHLTWLTIRSCPSIIHLPFLSTLVDMHCLYFENCVNLRAVEGCNTMTELYDARFVGCKSLASLPLDQYTLLRMSTYRLFPNRDRKWSHLRIEGSMFASIEMAELWVMDEEAPLILREASFAALAWELTTNLREKPRERQEWGARLLKSVGAYLLQEWLLFRKSLEYEDLAVLGDWADLIEKEKGRSRKFRFEPRVSVENLGSMVEWLRGHADVPFQHFESDVGLQMQCLAALSIL